MPHYMCVQCGVQYAESAEPPSGCLICEDERQYINPNGQTWTTLEALQQGHHNVFTKVEPGLTSIVTEPSFAIGQRAHLVQTPAGNVLWDCISLIDEATIQTINELGGLAAIAISHPHFYSTIAEWSRAFGGIPVYIHNADQQWVMRYDPAIIFWDGEQHPLLGDTMLVHCGGHFKGSTVLHWPALDEKGLLLTGDTIYVVADPRWVSFMYSYPNLIPLPPAKINHIVEAVRPFAFDRLYNAFGRAVAVDARSAVIRSAERYIEAMR